ncbi:hypothetical protein LOTGIDRAFT_175677 [Lottia gigantea]|uniref:Mid2 domain-containing protein n=1 Tax=Lottia gigantea TaxID=225164 RepID=V4A7F5_LOTGI|nr:hypothetical protein LOTGIDRAFT_175677 [Lottia gigantea]ESO92682.1 hypothetical protein LOTGIDRAFT_175677 [Lottia gigantea]
MVSVFLYRNNKNDPTNCWCQIISETGSLTQVIFNVSTFIGQQYKLSISNGTSTSYFNNDMFQDNFYTSGSMELRLDKNKCSGNDGLEFGINIASTPDNINITCHNTAVTTPKLCPQTNNTDTTTATSPLTTISPTTTISPATSIVTEPSDTAPIGTNTASSVEIYSTEKASNGTTNSQNNKTTDSTTDDLGIGLIGGIAGGAVVLIILILILIICFVRRKRRKKDQYDQPSPARPLPDAGYVTVDIGQHDKDNNSSPSAVVIEDSADSVSSRQPATKQGGDGQIQMEIIENDLYVSSDDVMNYESNDDNNINGIPEVEYAVVNKKRKPDKPLKETSVDSGVSMSSNEPNSDHDRKFVLGPQGDEYTLVTKT